MKYISLFIDQSYVPAVRFELIQQIVKASQQNIEVARKEQVGSNPVKVILIDDTAKVSNNLPSSSISYTYILYIPLGISYVHPITVVVHTGEHINDTVTFCLF